MDNEKIIFDKLDLQLYQSTYPEAYINNINIVYLKDNYNEIRNIYHKLNYSEKYIDIAIKWMLKSNFAGLTILNNNHNIEETYIVLFAKQESTLWHELTHVDDFKRFINKNNYHNISHEDFIKLPIYESFILYSEIRAHYIGILHCLELRAAACTLTNKKIIKPDVNFFIESVKTVINKIENSNQNGNFEAFLHAFGELFGSWSAYRIFFKMDDEVDKWFEMCAYGAYKKFYDFSFEIKDKKADELKDELQTLQKLYEPFVEII